MDTVGFITTMARLLMPGLNMTVANTPPIDPTLLMTTADIGRSHGFQCETHSVTTEDGYSLTAHRFLPATPIRGAILIMSGLNGCSDNFVMLGRNHSLASMMAAAGYDVVLGNQRGCTYSRGHRKWTRKDPEYWKYTLDDVGRYDMPALVSLAQRLTGQRRLFYVGYSAGANSFYTWLELLPAAQEIVRAAFMLGPGVFFKYPHTKTMKMLAHLPDSFIEKLWQSSAEILGRPRSFVQLSWQMCRADSPLRKTCERLVAFLTGVTSETADIRALDFIMAHGTCGTSTTATAHYAQNLKAGKFQAFDWGRVENLRRYGRDTPPEYLLQNISVPIALFLGRNDRFISMQDGELLSRVTSRNLGAIVVPIDGFDHFDFITHRLVSKYVYERILKFMEDF